MANIRVIPRMEVAASKTLNTDTVLSGLSFLSILIGAGVGIYCITPNLIAGRHSSIGDIIAAVVSWLIVISSIYFFAHTVCTWHSIYVPGKSLSRFRGNKSRIANYYRFSKWLGIAIATVGAIGVFLGISKPFSYIFIGIWLAAYGYRGTISQAVHASVDHVAVELLRGSGLIAREKVYASYTNFNADERVGKQPDGAVVGVLADSIVFLFTDSSGWRSAHRKFSEISQIGIHNSWGSELTILIRFMGDAQYKLVLDLSRKLTTEPLTFTRQFLEAIDSFVTARNVSSTRLARPRIITDPDGERAHEVRHPRAGESVISPEPTATTRKLELASDLVREFKHITMIDDGRSIELDFQL